MADDDKDNDKDATKPPPAAQHEVDAAVEEATATDHEDGILEQVHAADVAASVAIGKYRDTPIIKTLAFLSEISDQPPAFTVAAVTALGGLLTGRKRMAEVGLRSLAVLTIATAAKASVKATVTRTRPFMLLDHAEYDTKVGGPNDGPWNSFPSGHTANAVSVARAIGRVYPDAAGAAGLLAAGIAAVQVPRGAHHPIDVVAGAALGWAVEAGVNAVWPDEATAARKRD